MEEKVNQINKAIEDKRDILKEHAKMYFDALKVSTNTKEAADHNTTQKGIPPISYILYGIAGLSAVGTIASDSKLLCIGLAAASAFGGYKLSKHRTTNTKNISTNSNVSTNKSKNEIISKAIDAIKNTTKEWEEFMEVKQNEIQSAIDTSSLDENQKDSLSSKVFVYEIIDINIYELSNMINTAKSADDTNKVISLYKDKLLTAIDKAAASQIAKYKDLAL